MCFLSVLWKVHAFNFGLDSVYLISQDTKLCFPHYSLCILHVQPQMCGTHSQISFFGKQLRPL